MNGADSGDDGRNGDSVSDQGTSRLGRDRGTGPTPTPAGSEVRRASGPGDQRAGATPGQGGEIPPETMELSPIFRSWSDPSASTASPERCHFLRTIGADGRLGDPLHDAALTHRCAAFGEPLPLSLRQQELVCLQRVHVSCPRYLRGALVASEAVPEPEPEEVHRGMSKVTALGLVLLAASFVLGLTIMTGLLPGTHGGASQAPVAVGPSSPSDSAAPSPTDAPTDTAAPSPTSSASGSQSPSPTPTPTPTPAATPVPTPEPWPTCPPGQQANRMVCLKPCQDQANCYVYMVHVADQLKYIASYFGIAVSTIRNWNPWLGATGTPHPGQTLRIPPPTKP